MSIARAGVSIVLGPGATPVERLAADELTAYLSRMGNERPVTVRAPKTGSIYLGLLPADIDADSRHFIEHSLSGQDPDSFVLRTASGRLIIYGNSPRASLYGAYEYLKTLGVRWYYPGEDNEVVPKASIHLDGYSVRQTPSFHKRGIIVFPNTQGLDDLIAFAARMKLNTVGLHSSDGYNAAAKRIEARGLTASLERHFFGDNFCPDDQAQLERERNRLVDFVGQLPAEMDEFFLWVADKFLAPCTSAAYAGYNVSDLVLRFSNEMAKILDHRRPGAKFAFLSYLSTWEPPKHEKPDGRLLLEWAPISQSFAHSIVDKKSDVNTRLRTNFEKQLQMFGPQNTQVLGYWLDDTLFSRAHYGKLPYNPKALKSDLEYFRSLGIPAVTTFGIMTGRDYFLQHASPAVFLYPALLWDVTADTRSIMREYCRTYFADEKAVAIYDLLADADRMIGVENGQIRYENLNAPEFLEKVAKAVSLTTALLERQTSP
ncbi:MAG: hypothetical protein JWO48_2873, partial [Bryobacterales bacterium]|nr:hypothetical protein [Bryobacterales bacterium]